MEQVEKSVEVNCPIRTVYNQWTQFEEFPHFMSGVKEVRQIDDTHVHWRAEIWGKEKEWDAEITEQEPDKRISWKSVSGAPNAGTVRFEPLDAERTRIRLAMAYEPEGAVEKVGDALGILSGSVEDSVEGFKKFIESRGQETGAWRGEVGRQPQGVIFMRSKMASESLLRFDQDLHVFDGRIAIERKCEVDMDDVAEP